LLACHDFGMSALFRFDGELDVRTVQTTRGAAPTGTHDRNVGVSGEGDAALERCGRPQYERQICMRALGCRPRASCSQARCLAPNAHRCQRCVGPLGGILPVPCFGSEVGRAAVHEPTGFRFRAATSTGKYMVRSPRGRWNRQAAVVCLKMDWYSLTERTGPAALYLGRVTEPQRDCCGAPTSKTLSEGRG